MEARIPIKNLYYIFCYAWDRLAEGRATDVGGDESPELADLFANVLSNGVDHLLRRGLDRGYVSQVDQMEVIRGRILLTETLRTMASHVPRAVCGFDELQHNVLHNQVLKSTLVRLSKVESLNEGLAHRLKILQQELEAITVIRIDKSVFRRLQFNRNNAYYDFLMRICELVFDSTLPEEGGKRYRFSEILRDDQQMARVFEDFVRNFYRLEQRKLAVTSLHLRWDAVPSSELDKALLPIMRTDIHLQGDGRRIIIDTKYYSKTLQLYHEKQSVQSGHLYQIYAYLKNAEVLHEEYERAEGIVLYPTVGEELDAKYDIQGHPVRFLTLNLDQPWTGIREDLLSILEKSPD